MKQLILLVCVSHTLALYSVERISKVDSIVNNHFDLLKPKLEKNANISKGENKSSTDGNVVIFKSVNKITKRPEINGPPLRVDLENPKIDKNKDTSPTMLSALLPVIEKQNKIEDIPIKSIEFPSRKVMDDSPLFGQVHILHKMLRQLKNKDTNKVNHEPKIFENKKIEEIKPINQSIENQKLIEKQEAMTQEVKAIEELVKNVKSELESIQNSKQTETSTTILPDISTLPANYSTEINYVATKSNVLENNTTLTDTVSTILDNNTTVVANSTETPIPATSTQKVNPIFANDPTADVKNIVDSYINEKYDIDELVRGMQDRILQTIDENGSLIKTRNDTKDNSSTIELSFNYNKAESEKALLEKAAIEKVATEEARIEASTESSFLIEKKPEKIMAFPDANKLYKLEKKVEEQGKTMKKLDKKLTNLIKLVKKSNNYKLYSILPDDMQKLQRGQMLKVLMKPRPRPSPQRGHKRFAAPLREPLREPFRESIMSASVSSSSSSSSSSEEMLEESEEFAPSPHFYPPDSAGILPSGMKGKRKYRWKMNGSMKI